MKGIVNAVIVIVLLGMLGIKLYSITDADSTRVAELVAKAEQNEEAKILVARFLSETPAPTVGEVVHVDSEVEKILVKETAKNAASDAGLKPVAKPVESSGTEADPVSSALIQIAFGIVALAIALAMVGAYKRGKAGC